MAELDTNYGADLLGRVTKGYALRNLLTESKMNEMKLAQMPEEINWLKKSREQEFEKGATEAKKAKFDLATLENLSPLVKAKSFGEYATIAGMRMTFDQYQRGGRQFLLDTAKPLGEAAMKLAESTLPDPDQIVSEAGLNNQMPQYYFENVVKRKSMMSIKDQLELMEKESRSMTAKAK